MGTPLTDVKGIGPSTAGLLMAHGIRSAEDLAVATPGDLSAVPGFGGVRAQLLIQAAIALLADREPAPHAEPPPSTVITADPLVEQPPDVALPGTPMEFPSGVADVKKKTTEKGQAPGQEGRQAKEEEQKETQGQIEREETGQEVEEEVIVPGASSLLEPVPPRSRSRRRRRGSNASGSGTAVLDVQPQPASSPRRPPLPIRPARPPVGALAEAEPRTTSIASASFKETSISMNAQMSTSTMALFCDFENVALGVRDARYSAFDIQKVLERLLLKGNIVVRKAYCDWERYKDFKAPMHEAAFELIEIPHVRQSGKNSADIRMVVDALDLCYTKSHLDTFVILSGDSDFTPLVSKLRENNKMVIGVGVKQSTSDLLTSNCDEFIFYDDLLRESEKEKQRRKRIRTNTAKVTPKVGQSTEEAKMQEALDLVLETVEDLFEERGGDEKVWGSMIKQAVKRRKPGFNERYHGFRTFSKLLEEAAARGMLQIQHDEKSGGYIIEGFTQDEEDSGR